MLAPFPLPEGAPQTLSVQYFADDRSVIVLLAGGDIAVLQLEDPEVGAVVEVVGSIDSGIKAAAWSPDDEQLVLVTGELKCPGGANRRRRESRVHDAVF